VTQKEFLELIKKPEEFNSEREKEGYAELEIKNINNLTVEKCNLKGVKFSSCYLGKFSSCNYGKFSSCNSGKFSSCNSGKFSSCNSGKFSSCNSGKFSSCYSGEFSYCNSGEFSYCNSGKFSSCNSGKFSSCNYGKFSSCYYGVGIHTKGNLQNSYIKNNWCEFKLKNCPQDDIEGYIQFKKIEIIEGKLKLYKIVHENEMDFHTGKIHYKKGEIITAPDWDENYNGECGNGIHLSSSPDEAKTYHNNGIVKSFLVDPKDIKIYPRNLTKIRAKTVEVLD